MELFGAFARTFRWRRELQQQRGLLSAQQATNVLGLEAITSRLEAITSRLEAIACRLEANACRLEGIACRLEAMARRLEAIAGGWRSSPVG